SILARSRMASVEFLSQLTNRAAKESPMHRRRAAVMALVALAFAATLAEAASLAPKKSSEVRTLRLNTTQAIPPCNANAPYQFNAMFSGDGSNTPFAIPAGQVFVVIGVDWAAVGYLPGTAATVWLQTCGMGGCPVVWNDTVFADSAGAAGDTA